MIKIRKVRKDKGKKKKNIIKFPKIRGHKTELKLFIYKKRRMSKEGLKRFRPDLRAKITKWVYVPVQRIDVDVNYLSNEEKLKNFCIEFIGFPGYFLIKGMSGSVKSKRGLKWVTIFEAEIIEKGDGNMVCFLRKLNRINRYWFYERK